jgi:hypothetical protein
VLAYYHIISTYHYLLRLWFEDFIINYWGVLDTYFAIKMASIVICRKLSHLNLLLWNPWTKLNQTWQGWSLGGSLSKLCPTAPPSIQDTIIR